MAELKGVGGTGDPAMHDRLDQIEQSIHAVAVEVERIGEGQRFLMRLANERPLSAANAARAPAAHP